MLVLCLKRQQDQMLAKSFELYAGTDMMPRRACVGVNSVVKSQRSLARKEGRPAPSRVDEALQAAINRRTKSIG
jgi:hypothetical protein